MTRLKPPQRTLSGKLLKQLQHAMPDTQGYLLRGISLLVGIDQISLKLWCSKYYVFVHRVHVR